MSQGKSTCAAEFWAEPVAFFTELHFLLEKLREKLWLRYLADIFLETNKVNLSL